ncbi:MAG: flagellar motor protein MotB [Defluviitaleaceae bacterium]|nr:flagellar motor protein MotB [Defluviitaleaceae bacterium]
MAKKKKDKPKDAESSWMASYTDLVTVLFALFVMLYALSEVDEDLWSQFVMAAAFNPTVSPFDFGAQGINDLMGNGVSILPHFELQNFDRPQNMGGNDGDSDMAQIAEMLQTYFGEELASIADGAIQIEYTDGQIHLMFMGDMYFDSGRATLRPDILPVIAAVGTAIGGLREMGHDIRVDVEGHTDNQPISTAQFPSNWHLSSARALTVMLYLLDMGVIEATNISHTGRGEFQPIGDNTTDEGRQQNRRVEIFITQETRVQVLPIEEE